MPSPTPTRDGDAVLSDVKALTARIDKADAILQALYAERHRLFHEGRTVDPPVTHRALGEAAGISEPMVVKTVRRPLPE